MSARRSEMSQRSGVDGRSLLVAHAEGFERRTAAAAGGRASAWRPTALATTARRSTGIVSAKAMLSDEGSVSLERLIAGFAMARRALAAIAEATRTAVEAHVAAADEAPVSEIGGQTVQDAALIEFARANPSTSMERCRTYRHGVAAEGTATSPDLARCRSDGSSGDHFRRRASPTCRGGTAVRAERRRHRPGARGRPSPLGLRRRSL